MKTESISCITLKQLSVWGGVVVSMSCLMLSENLLISASIMVQLHYYTKDELISSNLTRQRSELFYVTQEIVVDSDVFVGVISNRIWAMSWENLFMPYANNKGTDQSSHPGSLISTFVVHCLGSTISLVYIAKISAAEQAGLSLTGSRTPEDRLSRDMVHL